MQGLVFPPTAKQLLIYTWARWILIEWVPPYINEKQGLNAGPYPDSIMCVKYVVIIWNTLRMKG